MTLPARFLAASSMLLTSGAALAAQGQVYTVGTDNPNAGAVFHLDLNSVGLVEEQLEIADGLNGVALDSRSFGWSVASIGDLDGSGTMDLAVGAPWTLTVWILFREADGSIASQRAIRATDVPFAGVSFGDALAFLGDLDGDGRPELAVGQPLSGVLWILSLEADGSVAHTTLVDGGQDSFGTSLAAIGDLDGDGVPDLAAGATGDDDGAHDAGALWILFLNADATVKAETKISGTSGGFGGGALAGDEMGSSVCPLGDLDDDGVVDLALGAHEYGLRGCIWILFLSDDGTVRAKKLINSHAGGLSNPNQQGFGAAVAPLGDLDDNGIEDVAVGAPTTGAGSVFVLFLNADGTVKAQTRLESSIVGLVPDDQLGASLANLGDLDGDGRADLAVGAPGRDGLDGADFTNLQAAVNAAANGDTLLVRPGNYGTTTVSAKSLTIVGHVAGTVRATPLRVEGLAASQTVALKQLRGDSRSPTTRESSGSTSA